ncbi:hypothetical protein [Acidovorax sp.]|uniref:hypothetical protein n=1 Tax=Acidovorax sp. TaxID=1872122 RepID=UPI00391F91F0
MGDFLKRVRSGAVVGPRRNAFTPSGWRNAFAAAGAIDESDQRIYDAALLIYAKLQRIRSRLAQSSTSSLSATTKLRAYVAASNFNFLVVRARVHEEAEKLADEHREVDRAKKLEEIAAAVKLTLFGETKWAPDDVFASLVDGIEVPVRFALQGNPALAGSPRMNQVRWNDILLELNLGVMFHSVEDLWDDCLWNDYGVTDKGGVKTFVPEDADAKRGHALGIVRRISLSLGHAVVAKSEIRSLAMQGLLPRIREVRAVEHEGKTQVIRLSKPGEVTRTQEELLVLRGFASEPYYSELLAKQTPALGDITLSEILDAWMVISRAAQVLVTSLSGKAANSTEPDASLKAGLPEHAPVLQIGALVKALDDAVGIKTADGRKLVEFFTFRGKPGQEIWASPLIPVGLTTVAPVFAAVVTPNLRRLVDVWMRQAGIELKERGPAFEAHVRAIAHKAIVSSEVLANNAISIREDYTFKPSVGRSEQIDLLFVIGATVFLAESKCILEPTEAKGVAMHRSTVLGAAEQAQRKSQCLMDHAAEFVSQARRFGIALPQDFNVFPFVVVSTATHVGIPANGVPVVDKYILERFLFGELEDVLVQGEDLEIQERIKHTFYSNVAEAERTAPTYFASPPQVKRLLDGMKLHFSPIFPLEEQDWEGSVLTFDCQPLQAQ